jgi:hypothetical protein
MNFKKIAVAAAALALIAGCSQSTGPKDDLSGQYSIYLTGRVLNANGNPVADAVARLAGRNLSDTTDANGWYLIAEKKAAGLPKTAAASVGDSVEILKDGQFITYLGVPTWIDTLPDVRLVQRNIGGDFLAPPGSFSMVTATLTVGSDPVKKIKELWYNTANQSYSGFIYFVYTTQSVNYSVYVSVYNVDSVLIGRSVIVNFPSSAGDIDMPAFDPNNAVPGVYAGDDTTVSVNDTIRLHAVASDSFGGSIAKWEWSINGVGYPQPSSGNLTIVAPADSNSNFLCAVRVTDNDGLSMADTMIVNVVLDPPAAFAGNDTMVARNSQVTLHGTASQQFGTIVKWEWDINNSGFVQTSTGDTTFTTPDSAIAVYPCILRVTDDDGQTGEDTVFLQVGISGPVPIYPYNNDSVAIYSFYFEWNAVAAASYYILQVSNASDFSALVVNDTALSTTHYGDSSRFASGSIYYWRVTAYTSGSWSEWSKVWSFSKGVAWSAPVITTQPVSSDTVMVGDSVTFSVVATGSPSLTYQWQFSLDGGTTWMDLGGGTNANLTLAFVSNSMSGWMFRAVVTNIVGSVTSNEVTLTVY